MQTIIFCVFCTLYVVMQILMGTISILNQKLFNYSPLAVTLFYINIFFPMNLFQFGYTYSLESLFDITSKQFRDISIASIIYNIECVATYWALQYIPISFYITGRTLTAFINVIYSKLYLIKHINMYYYIGLLFLIFTYIFMIYGNWKQSYTTDEKISIAIIFISSFTTSTYNNMAEKFFDEIKTENPIFITKMKAIYRVIFNAYGFVFVMSTSLICALYLDQFTANIGPNILYSITGICFQTIILVRLTILSADNLSGNQVMTCLDLLRRILANMIGYSFFGDYLNTFIIFANIFMAIGCVYIAVGIIKN